MRTSHPPLRFEAVPRENYKWTCRWFPGPSRNVYITSSTSIIFCSFNCTPWLHVSAILVITMCAQCNICFYPVCLLSSPDKTETFN